MPDRYRSYNELAHHEVEGRDYEVHVAPRHSPIAIVAPHGGCIEPGTSEIATALADDRYSLFRFDGLKAAGSDTLHLTSTRFDEPRGLSLVKMSHWVMSIHGCLGGQPKIFLGGLDYESIHLARTMLMDSGFDASSSDHRLNGADPNNICNRGLSGKGLQLELTRGLRLTFFDDLDHRPGRQNPTDQFLVFLVALQEIVSKIEVEIKI
jgi:phage replication-related protein YjqB (UPF0714/DUF867 family)